MQNQTKTNQYVFFKALRIWAELKTISNVEF